MWNLFEYWIWDKLEPFLSLFAENLLDCTKIFVCGKLPWSKKDFCLQKIFLFTKHLFDQLKLSCKNLSCFWKISMTVKSFLTVGKFSYCGKVLGLWKMWKVYRDKFIKENLLSWLQKKIIGLIILRASASVETIEAYILSLEQKESRV